MGKLVEYKFTIKEYLGTSHYNTASQLFIHKYLIDVGFHDGQGYRLKEIQMAVVKCKIEFGWDLDMMQ